MRYEIGALSPTDSITSTFLTMSELVNKLNSINLPKVAQLTPGSSKTVGDLWNDVIFNLLPDKDVVLRWHKVLMEYVERPDAMFAIRGYNTEPTERYGRLRRGFLTSTNRDYSFFYTDNFHATYFLKMAMDGFVPTVNELLEAYNSRRFPVRFGRDTSEEREMMAMPRGKDPGIQVAGYKVAHIYNVGTDYMCGQQRLSLIKDIVDVYYPRGEREDWKWVSDHTGEHYERRLEVSASARPYLVAAFLRFVHPFNYFLVPKKNAATVDVSENKCLIGFVKSMFRKLYGAAYDEFERKIMVQANDGVTCSETYPLNISYGCGIMQYNRVAAAPQQNNGVPQSQRMAFKAWLRERGYAEGTANSYASGVNTSSRFARERLDWDIDFFSITDAVELEQRVNSLLRMPAYREYDDQNNHSPSCGLARYMEFLSGEPLNNRIVHRERVAAPPQQNNGVQQSQRMAFKEWLRERGYAKGAADSYASGVNTSSVFARERLDWDIDFFAMTDAVELEKRVKELFRIPSYREYADQKHHSPSCGLARYVEFVRHTQG